MSNTSSQVYDVDKGATISVELSSGDLHVQGWDKGQVSVECPDGEAKVRRDDDTWRISAPRAGRGDMTVRIPHQTDLSIRVASGDVHLEDIVGDITMQVMSGDVASKRLRGALSATVLSGDIALRDCELHALDLDSLSGDTLVETGLSAEGQYKVRSLSGGLRLALPEKQACTLHARLLSGDLHCDLPHETESKAWGRMTTRINGGGVDFEVRSTSGDIHVTRWAAPAEEEESVASAAEEEDLGSGAPSAEPEPFALDEEASAAPEKSAPSAESQRMAILKAIEQGELSVEEGLARLRALG
ncbi:MAG: hypothetical protein FJZ90_00570 [Chloroflexi bacterium]|nr:hypothetical protein [Chloroflexota bacterium]